jgi:hypothetical protein
MKKHLAAILLAVVLAGLQGCLDRGERIRGYRLSSFFDDCNADSAGFGEMITLGDPGERFLVRLPYAWDVQEVYEDTLYGIMAGNILEAREDIRVMESLSVTAYSSASSLDEYFRGEIGTLKKERGTRIVELGKTTLSGRNARWVMFRSGDKEQSFMNLVAYVRNDKENEIYLLQSTVHRSGNYRGKLCRLKELIASFEIMGDE